MFSCIIRRGLLLLSILLLAGCKMVVLHPSGDIAIRQAHLVVVTTLLMLLIIIPVIFLVIIFAWRYRKSNSHAKYDPNWHHSTKLELVIWGIPLAMVITLGTITWISTHRLDPFRPLDRIDATHPIPAGMKPLEVDVVALDWKWLFIYPQQGIATVNKLVTPVNVPVRFKITSTTAMNAFYIPAMAGMIYAMPGMQTELNAVMNKPGVYDGLSANYSGAGFYGMHFKYDAVSNADFEQWVQQTRAAGGDLDRANYLTLAKPSQRDPVRLYSAVDPALFGAIVNDCVVPGQICVSQDKTAAPAAREAQAGHPVMAQAPARMSTPNSHLHEE